MAGYIHDPLQNINLITDNLRDRYKGGFPVLKEIIQNADDAGSEKDPIHFEFGVAKGISDAEHPLLQGDALYFFNDGSFSDSDHTAIRSFGLNRKAIEQHSIGKFGLGMKSVFHFCEAFFFLAKNPEKNYAEILNPWSGGEDFPSLHDDWNHFSVDDPDADRMKHYIQPILNKFKQQPDSWFLLWLPLRSKSHLLVNDQKVGSIISEFPGDDDQHLSFLFERNFAQKLSSLLPFLRRINTISFWESQKDGQLFKRFKIVIDAQSSRIGVTGDSHSPRELAGTVKYQNSFTKSAPYSLIYSGTEIFLDIPELKRLRNSDLWPKSYVRNEIGMSIEAPDKAQGQSAVAFSRSDEKEERGGCLKICWAVFLPVESTKEKVSCEGKVCYQLTLHGYFFVDSGRADIEGLQNDSEVFDIKTSPNNEAELRRRWNIHLSRKGTLPLVLPALEQFAQKTSLSSDDIWYLSSALDKTKLFEKYRKIICETNCWVCCLTPQGRKWRLIPSDTTLFPLPAPPASAPDRPWKTLPNLESLNDRQIFLLHKDAPHLLSRPLPQWNEPTLLKVLQIKGKEVFSDQGLLDYLLGFLADQAVRHILKTGRLQQKLQEILNGAFISLGIQLRQLRKKVQAFVSYIDPAMRYAVKHNAPEVIRELQICETETLILANDFDAPDCSGKARLSLQDSLTLLKKLNDMINRFEKNDLQKEIDDCRAIAGEILSRQGNEQRRELLLKARELRVLGGYDCRAGKRFAISASDLKGQKEKQLLFLYSQGINDQQRLGLAYKLQQAINERVVLIRSDTAQLVFGKNHQLLPCHADSVLDALGAFKHGLSSIKMRKELIRDVSGADLSSEQRNRGLRYLLHGLVAYFENKSTLWMAGYDQSPVWEKLWKQLQSHNEDGWNLIDRRLAGEIPSNKWPRLSIREIKPADILDELRKDGASGIDGNLFTQDERNAVLRELEDDKDLWKSLPFHLTVWDKLVPIQEGRAYLETDIDFPEKLHRYADIIRRSDDLTIKRQQQDRITLLSANGVIGIALVCDEPFRFWKFILDNLLKTNNDFDFRVLRDVDWLLDNAGQALKPSDVIYLKDIQDDVDRMIAASARGAFWAPQKLNNDLRNHPAFSLLENNCFASSDTDGLEKFALLLSEAEEYRVGQLKISNNELSGIANTLAGLPAHLRLPGWYLLDRSITAFSLDLCEEFLINEILKPIDPKRITTILHYLQAEHVKAGKVLKSEILVAFNVYLTALVRDKEAKNYLAGLHLLNKEGDWKTAEKLCSEAEGVADSHLIDDSQKQLLTDIIVHADRQTSQQSDDNQPMKRNLQPEISASADTLKDFFAEWEGLVAPEIICAFLSLLGDDPKMRVLAEQYRGRHSVEWIRDNIPWETHQRVDELQRQEWMYGLSQQEAFAQHRFIVICCEGEMTHTCSILGKEIEVPLKSRFDSLIIGGLFYEYPDQQINNVRIRLRRPDMQKVSPSELSGFLKASSEYLLKKAYNQRNYDLTQLWAELDKSEQLDIRIAQQLVLNHIPFYLRQLGVHTNPHLRELLNAWNEARYKREEYYESADKRHLYEKEERQLLNKIQELLKSDSEIQEVVLNAVRAKIKDFQYSPASIPFELFQNADDAVVELATIKAHPKSLEEVNEDIIPEEVRRFLVIKRSRSLSFVHWGRAINAVGASGFPGREKGFHHDLEKMLVLSSSDKTGNSNVTGKFGLGFKSVLLACSKPRLISGQLATEIIAGLCPQPLPPVESTRMRMLLHELGIERRWQGTLVELPLTDTEPADIIDDFERLAGIMTIFSKQIRRIDIRYNDGQSRSWEWIPKKIKLSDSACLEIREFPLTGDFYLKGIITYFRFPSGGILFVMGPEGFRKLPPEVPAVWVVAPTREGNGLGFAINCMYDLDAGRARLAGNSSINKQKTNELGQLFGKALRNLFALSREKWTVLKRYLRLEEDLTVYDFWNSCWEVISEGLRSKGNSEISSHVSSLLAKDNGLGYLLVHDNALPNGLWGNFQSLTRPEKVKFVLRGVLENEHIFMSLIEWEYFRNLLGTPDSSISYAIYTVLRKIVPSMGQTSTQWRTLSLSIVLANYAETERKITPDSAMVLGKFINPADLKGKAFEKEKNDIIKVLYKLSFKALDGSFQSAGRLLATQKHNSANPDEAKRSLFAPDKYVLHDDYHGTAMDFFFACREKITLPVEEMAQWIIDAPSDRKKEKGLRYLLEGEHGEKVARILRERGPHRDWLSDLRLDSACFNNWDQNDISEILIRKLPSIEELHRQYADILTDSFELPEKEFKFKRHAPEEVLRRIHTWWDTHKEQYLKEYEGRIYPSGVSLNLKEDESGRIDRNSWLILLTLSHFHTMGRQKDVQHKGFIERCQQRGWWEVFARENPETRANEWMEVLEQYIGEQVETSEYELWMNRFPAIYRFARYLEDYEEAFLSVERMESLSDLTEILKTRTSKVFQGGGISAPPIERSLGIGACFTLRELKRKNILKGTQVIPFCYVPSQKIRNLCTILGCWEIREDARIENSKHIYHFLCQTLGEKGATFCNSYDIPLQLISEREDVLMKILN